MPNKPGPNKPGPKGPHGKPHVVQGTLRQLAWRAMRLKGKFSLSDLVRNALPEGNIYKDPHNNLGRYVKALCAVGVLVEMKRRAAPTSLTSNGEKRWLLVRDLGRKSPVMRALGVVYDPNSGTVISTEVSDEQ